MSASICATASCWPTGLPHWTRSAAKRRATWRHHLPARRAGRRQREAAGVERDERELEALALAPEQVLLRHAHAVKRISAFSMPRRPMNSRRCTISTPGVSVSTMKALIGPGLPSLPGVRAITTSSSAIEPLVHHSFSPSMQIGAAVGRRRGGGASCAPGSEPTSFSVSANAEIAPRARRGSRRFFCSSVPNSLSGCGTPIDWCAESSATSAPTWCRPAPSRARRCTARGRGRRTRAGS